MKFSSFLWFLQMIETNSALLNYNSFHLDHMISILITLNYRGESLFSQLSFFYLPLSVSIWDCWIISWWLEFMLAPFFYGLVVVVSVFIAFYHTYTYYYIIFWLFARRDKVKFSERPSKRRLQLFDYISFSQESVFFGGCCWYEWESNYEGVGRNMRRRCANFTRIKHTNIKKMRKQKL